MSPSQPVCLQCDMTAAVLWLDRCRINRSTRTLAPAWVKPVDEGLGFEAGVLSATPHPIVPGGALIIVGTSGGALGVWEAGGKLQPHHVGTHHLPGEPKVTMPARHPHM